MNDALNDIKHNSETMKYYCKICDFKCCKRSNYTYHLITNKHKIMTNDDELNAKNAKSYVCYCGNKYKYRQGLHNHKKKCRQKEPEQEQEQSLQQTGINVISMFHEMMRENQKLRELLIDQSNQAQESQIEMQQQMLELASENKIVNNHNNTINNKFNLNFFLNEQCKNAMDLTDFLNTIEVRVEDVTNMGRFGFAEGISRIFMKALNNLDVYERPIHCCDLKREMMYIKDNGIWEKDGDIKHHMKRAIKCISFKNIRKLADWRDANPGWAVLHSQLEEDYLHITSESMGGSSTDEDEKLYNKIIRKVATEVVIDKKLI